MREIKLTKGKYALVDDGDYEYINQWKWCINGGGYAFRMNGRGGVYMHRVILDAKQGEEVDHIDGDPLNNRRSNIRICTHSQNMYNRVYRGVYWRQNRSRWVARVKVNGKHIHIGSFRDEQQATGAYKAAKLKYHGEFAPVGRE